MGYLDNAGLNVLWNKIKNEIENIDLATLTFGDGDIVYDPKGDNQTVGLYKGEVEGESFSSNNIPTLNSYSTANETSYSNSVENSYSTTSDENSYSTASDENSYSTTSDENSYSTASDENSYSTASENTYSSFITENRY